MTQSSLHAAAFYQEVAEHRAVWTIRDDRGFPAPLNASGERAQPFWSTQSRAMKVISSVPAYAAFIAIEISWEAFCAKWVPGLDRDGILVGVNWSGDRATGYDLPASNVRRNVEAIVTIKRDKTEST